MGPPSGEQLHLAILGLSVGTILAEARRDKPQLSAPGVFRLLMVLRDRPIIWDSRRPLASASHHRVTSVISPRETSFYDTTGSLSGFETVLAHLPPGWVNYCGQMTIYRLNVRGYLQDPELECEIRRGAKGSMHINNERT